METNFALLVFLMFLATQASRLAPLIFLSKRDLSPRLEMWLSHVPIGIMTALIVPDFFVKGSGSAVTVNGHFVAAGVAALLVGLRTKNLVLTTVIGVLCVALLRTA